MAEPRLIAIDWGTTSARAYAVDASDEVVAIREAPLGVQKLAGGNFPAALATLLGDWYALSVPRIASGMVGSRQGWIEAPYVECPADIAALASHLAWTPGRELAIVPGMIVRDSAAFPDVMRGEETQIAGTIDDDEAAVLAVLPGTHSKWVLVERGRIVAFRSSMTGELYAVLLAHSILGRLAEVGEVANETQDAFLRGVASGLDDDGLAHLVFGARTLALTGEIAPREVADWLSGALIGNEIRSSRRWAQKHGVDAHEVVVVGSDALVSRYAVALAQAGITARKGRPDAAVRGLVRIAARSGVIH